MRVAVTGGAGFIGSHTLVALAERGHEPVVLDNLSNSSRTSVDRVAELTGDRPALHVVDLSDRAATASAFREIGVAAVVHFAARKHVPESVDKPIDYYRNNVAALANVLDACVEHRIERLVFSSSGSVYGEADQLPITEKAEHRPTNPYSATKSFGERMVEDTCARHSWLRATSLRYFNPAGAHPSGRIGEDPTGLLSNLLPVLMHVAIGNVPELSVYGDDFETPDGFGVRDYVHVSDVADIHAMLIEQLQPGHEVFNLGRGEGVSVKQMIDAVEAVTGRPVPWTLHGRRPGDVAALFGDTSKLDRALGRFSYRSLEQIVTDAWRWQSDNPGGYR